MKALLLALVLASPFANAKLLSMTVGRAEGHVFTSREVHLQHLLENALSSEERSFSLNPEDSKAFYDQVEKTILEYLVDRESKSFSTVRLSDEEFQEALKKLPGALFKSPQWQSLHAAPEEWKRIFQRKMQAKKFIRFRAQSSVIPISDAEAKRYFDEHRLKFGNLPFDQFKENVKVFLRRSQVEQRLKDWYEVLRSKYKARNFLSEI